MTTTEQTDIRPFTIAVDQASVDDLQRRLARTRYATPGPDESWDLGAPVSYLRQTVASWQRLDWRAVEARLNALPQFTTVIEGQTVHFVHVRSAEPDATPVLLLHTYPGSFAEFEAMVGPLTDPVAYGGRAEDAFDVVVPSMPGFTFSTPLADGPWTMARVARTYDALMRRLGYDAYGTHGSDGGAMVSRELAIMDPPGFLGAHVLQLFSFPSGAPGEFDAFTPEDYAALEFAGWFQSVGGYNQMNGTRPQTIAAALSDSPVGQLAYNELFQNFGNGTSLVSEEQILVQASLYWFTNTAATVVRYHYSEAHAGAEPQVNHGRTGVTVFADDFKTIRSLAERDNDRIDFWSQHPRGGHYAAMEVRELLVGDLRTFFG